MLLYLLSASFLLRLAQRQFTGLLFHEPPRSGVALSLLRFLALRERSEYLLAQLPGVAML